jgi:lactam utilization protein B
MLQIDINCDLGEGYPDDKLLMPLAALILLAELMQVTKN